MPNLVITESDGKTSTIDLGSRNRVTVGRSHENDVVLTDPTLSRRHAELVREPLGWLVRDLGSRNGTLLNGATLGTRTALRPGDRILIGRAELVFGPEDVPPARVVLSEDTIAPDDTYVMTPSDVAPESRPEMWFDILDEANRTLPHQTLDVLFPRILDLVHRALQPDRASILSRLPDGGLVCRAERKNDGQQGIPVSRTLARKVVDERVSVLVSDVGASSGGSDSLDERGVRSAMAVPLCDLDDVTGLIYLETLEKPVPFGKKDLRLLTLLGNAVATQIQNTQLREDKIRRRHLQEGAMEAAKIQERLLPVTFSDIPGYEFEWAYVSCFEVGGDYCDCLPLTPDRQGIAVADVAGKGIGAAMLMAVTQATLRTHAQVGINLDRLASHMNEALYTAAPDNRFVTFFFAELDHAAHRLRYVNVGHQPPPILVRSSGVIEELGAGSIPLGMLPEISCPVREVELGPADFLFACTDGVTDAMDPEESMFGDDRLRELLASLAGFPGNKVRGAVEQALASFARGAPQPDDLTMAVLRRNPG